MPELSMATRGPHQVPAIILQQADDFAHFHAIAGYLGAGIRRITDLQFTGPNRDGMSAGSRSMVAQRFGSGATAS